MLLYTASAMKEVDRTAIEEMGIPSLHLMENAGEAITRNLLLEGAVEPGDAVTILCGKGNNGGDGMVVGRLLRRMGWNPRVVLLAPPEAISGDAAVQFRRLRSHRVAWEVLDGEESLPDLAHRLEDTDVVIDAVLGTGIRGAVRGTAAKVIELVNGCGAVVAAVDIPSGLSGDAFGVAGPAIQADLTVTLAFAKPCLFTPEAGDLCGHVIVADIGIPDEAAERIPPVGEAVEASWALSRFSDRPGAMHKGRCGRILLICGSRGKAGAAVLAARGALRAGAGLVTVALPEGSLPVVASSLAEAMTLPLPETDAGSLSGDAFDALLAACGENDAVGCGSGMGLHEDTAGLARRLYGELPVPMAVDADALTAFRGAPDLLSGHAAPRLLTPHPGELGRLLGLKPSEVLTRRYALVPDRSKSWNVTLLLKGFRTLIAAPDRPWRMNLSGGPHMAAPGMGDVLTGITACLLGRGMEPFDAASLGAWWHGAAADEAYGMRGGYGILASEVADALPVVDGASRGLPPFEGASRRSG